ncbi:MAG: molybdopterin cofactor-binding domain-containing protein [Bacteroidota bacterium]
MSNADQPPTGDSKKQKKKFSRRKFLVRSSVGVGVLLGAGYLTRPMWRRSIAEMVNTMEAGYIGDVATPPLWFEITADNQIKLLSPKVEMGQGTFTGLAQLAAEELEVSPDQIDVVHAPSASGNLDGLSTGGSTSISSLYRPLRELAATMREMLKNEAASLLGVAVGSLSLAGGRISGGGKSMTYGEIAAQVTDWTIPDVPPLKDKSEFKYVGKPVPRVDLRAKVVGEPIFGMDASMPNMLYGAVVRPEKVGATFVGADTSAAEQLPGVVKIVQEDDFVGVVADSFVAAQRAKDAIKAEWKVDRAWSNDDLMDMIEVGKGKPISIQKAGKAKKVLADGDDIITLDFKTPIGAHAQLEPSGAVAYVNGDEATVMISTQVVKITRDEVAERLGIAPENVNIIPTYLGGGFGRRLHTPNAMQAAVLSRAVGRPVKCFFTRKEEFQKDTFRPPTHHVLRAKLTPSGAIEAISHDVSSGHVMFGSALLPRMIEPIVGHDIGAWRGGMFQYRNIPNFEATSWRVELPFATSWWRSLGLLANTFAIESFFDELALQAGKDPVQFRLDHIQDDQAGQRLATVIKTARDQSGYQDKVIAGRAMGFAASTDANSPCAHVVELSMTEDGIKVHKVTCVLDCGMAVNPDQVRAQCEGSIMMGMSAALYEKMELADSELSPTIYGPYQMALMKDTPDEIDVIILENDDKPGAVGEPPMGPIGAAIANAIYRLTNERPREMPFFG